MSNLLQHPRLLVGEGPIGYLLRLANANGLTLADLKTLGIFFQPELLASLRCLDRGDMPAWAHAQRLAWAREQWPTLWNPSSCRWCPHCLAEAQFWRAEWELLFVDACHRHGGWLVDRCEACDTPVRWTRAMLARCDCGHELSAARMAAAPGSVVQLAGHMSQQLAGSAQEPRIGVVAGLNLEQIVRLVRLIGSYGQPNPERRPQKIRAAGSLAVSWQVTSVAAEVLASWPDGFKTLLGNLLQRENAGSRGSLPARFGYFYSALFKRFAEPEFGFLRAEFEEFLAAHWDGALARRNTRLSEALLRRVPWVPAKHARRYLGVSAARLDQLAASGAVLVREARAPSGRRLVMVNRESMEQLKPEVSGEMDLAEASALLGVTRKRLRAILPQLVPAAQKVGVWAIPRRAMEPFLAVTAGSLLCREPSDREVTLDHILRFWSCSNEEVGQLLLGIRNAALLPAARAPGARKLGQLVFGQAEARRFLANQRSSAQHLTIPQVADALAVKQEVAYFLVRAGLLQAENLLLGKRSASVVSRESLDAFLAEFVFARDLARRCKTTSRFLQAQLEVVGIHPVASPSLGTCRQVIYRRTAALLNVLGIQW